MVLVHVPVRFGPTLFGAASTTRPPEESTFMKFSAFAFALFLGASVAVLAASNINCSVLQALAGDGGGVEIGRAHV